jgi:3-isopropylmalate/(R)-2-methylmalate dehydratase large subunit
LYYSVEFHGDAISQMTLDSRMVIPNMMAEFGVKNAYLPPDDEVFDYLAPRFAKRLEIGDWRTESRSEASLTSSLQSRALYPDSDAAYAAEHAFDASVIEPMVACPHGVDNVKPISDIRGTRVQQAFIGTCTNGRLEDIAAAAEIVRGKRVARGTRLLVIPASSQVLQDAMRQGYLETLTDAGAVIGVPGCGPCMGNHMGIPAPNEVTISSANRNFRGRMGTRDAEIFLASPAVVAASAVAGRIEDPRTILA